MRLTILLRFMYSRMYSSCVSWFVYGMVYLALPTGDISDILGLLLGTLFPLKFGQARAGKQLKRVH